MANVTLRNVRKAYPNGFEAIKGIDFDVGDGQFCVLVGPSGCGKSTLLRMVAGLETITSGEIDIGGRIVNQVEPAERDIAMVFQNYALYPHMSVYNNMAYGLRNRGMAKPEIDTRVQEAARILELGAMLERWSLRNAIVLGAGILLFGVKSFVEEGLLRQDPGYAAYMKRVRYRFIPGIF